MKLKQIILFTTIVILLSSVKQISFAQDYGNSSAAQGYINTKNCTVDYAAGIFHYKIPLYELQSGNYTLPVSLNYAANGVKYNALPGMFGYNWNLYAGGMVTRSKRGEFIDEHTKGYSQNNITSANSTTQKNVNERKIDGESDIFTASFGGRSVRFILNGNVPRPIERTNVKIEYKMAQDTVINEWIITDESGVKYIFQEKEYLVLGFNKFSTGKFTEKGDAYITSWLISKIDIPGSPSIHFEYNGFQVDHGRSTFFVNTFYNTDPSNSMYGNFYHPTKDEYEYLKQCVSYDFERARYQIDYSPIEEASLGGEIRANEMKRMNLNGVSNYTGSVLNRIYSHDPLYYSPVTKYYELAEKFDEFGSAIEQLYFLKELVNYKYSQLQNIYCDLGLDVGIFSIDQLLYLYDNYISVWIPDTNQAYSLLTYLSNRQDLIRSSTREIPSLWRTTTPKLSSISCGDKKIAFSYEIITSENSQVDIIGYNLPKGDNKIQCNIDYGQLTKVNYFLADSQVEKRLNMTYYEDNYSLQQYGFGVDVFGYRNGLSGPGYMRWDSSTPTMISEAILYNRNWDRDWEGYYNINNYAMANVYKFRHDAAKSRSLYKVESSDGAVVELEYEGNKIADDYYEDYKVKVLEDQMAGNYHYYETPLDPPMKEPMVAGIRIKKVKYTDRVSGTVDELSYSYPNGGQMVVNYYDALFTQKNSIDRVYSSDVFATAKPYAFPLGNNGVFYDYVEERTSSGITKYMFDCNLYLGAIGILAKIAQYDNNGYIINLKTFDYDYSNRGNSLLQIGRDLFYEGQYANNPRTGYGNNGMLYSLNYDGLTTLRSQKEYTFPANTLAQLNDNTQNVGALVNEVNYYYDNLSKSVSPTRVVTTLSNGDQNIVVNKTALELSSGASSFINVLLSNNMVGVPVKTQVFRKKSGTSNYILKSETVCTYDKYIYSRADLSSLNDNTVNANHMKIEALRPVDAYEYIGGDVDYGVNIPIINDNSLFSRSTNQYRKVLNQKYEAIGQSITVSEQSETGIVTALKNDNDGMVSILSVPHTQRNDIDAINSLGAGSSKRLNEVGVVEYKISDTEYLQCMKILNDPEFVNAYNNDGTIHYNINTSAYNRYAALMADVKYKLDHFCLICGPELLDYDFEWRSITGEEYSKVFTHIQTISNAIPPYGNYTTQRNFILSENELFCKYDLDLIAKMIKCIPYYQSYNAFGAQYYIKILVDAYNSIANLGSSRSRLAIINTNNLSISPTAGVNRYNLYVYSGDSQSLPASVGYKANGSTRTAARLSTFGQESTSGVVALYEIDLSGMSNVSNVTCEVLGDYCAVVPANALFEARVCDVKGNVIRKFNQNCQIERYDYDAAGRVVSQYDQSRKVKEVTYNDIISQ